jgi:hypothetical protein
VQEVVVVVVVVFDGRYVWDMMAVSVEAVDWLQSRFRWWIA